MMMMMPQIDPSIIYCATLPLFFPFSSLMKTDHIIQPQTYLFFNK